MARRMLTINEMYNKLKGMFVDKTSTTTQIMSGNILTPKVITPKFSTDSGHFVIKDLGNVTSADLIANYVIAGESGIYKFYETTLSRSSIVTINFNNANTSISGFCVDEGYLHYFNDVMYFSATFYSLRDSLISLMPIFFFDASSVASQLNGTVQYGIENSTLHIHGAFTPTETIAAGTKLFSTEQTLGAKMTHGSAINTGTTGAETFVGISIQTNGDVYCLGALTSGVAYNIAVTATM